MASNVVYLTEAGLQKLKDELDHLRSVERPAISAAIAEARDKGDLSENAEYDAAKEAQGMLEMRIAKLEDTVANARVLDESRIDTSTVQILNRVTLKNITTGKVVEYTLVSENEANLKEGKLSIGTPIAQALLGHKKGEEVDVTVPSGVLRFEILNIKFRQEIETGLCKAGLFMPAPGVSVKIKSVGNCSDTLLFSWFVREARRKRYFTVLTIFSNAAALFIARSARTFRLSRIPLAFILPMNSE